MALLDQTVSSRKLAAILSADVAGYSALMSADEEGTVRKLRQVRDAVLPLIESFGGRVIDLAGDGILAEFPSAVRAVESAAAVQSCMADLNAKSDPPMLFRIGVNVGDVIHEGERLYGDGINVAARLQAIAEPGGICISNKVHEEVRDRVKLAFKDLGDQDLKNILRPVRAFSSVLSPSASHLDPALSLPAKPSIAVLPFANISGDPEQEYFADGVVEEIIVALSRFRSLFVIARNSSFTYKGQSFNVKQIGRELGVRYILEGSVRKGGGRARVTAQLVDAISGAHLWADRYDRDLTDIFAVQDEITGTVAAIIEPALARAEQERVLRKAPTSLDVWDTYQRGLWHFHKYVADENKTAQSFFRQAIEVDWNFGPAHYAYAFSQHFDFWLYSTRSWTEVTGTGVDEARIAVSLDDQDSMAHAVLSFMQQVSGEWDSAIAEGRTAVNLNPNSAWSMGALGHALGWGGQQEEAIAYLRRAMRASPHDPQTWLWTFWMGIFQYCARDYEAAADTMRQVIRLRLGHPKRWLAAALGQLGRKTEAKEELSRAIAVSPPVFHLFTSSRPPWVRPEDHAHMLEGLRNAGWGQSEQECP